MGQRHGHGSLAVLNILYLPTILLGLQILGYLYNRIFIYFGFLPNNIFINNGFTILRYLVCGYETLNIAIDIIKLNYTIVIYLFF